MLEKCEGCGERILAGGITHDGVRYCRESCMEFNLHPGFCQSCLEATEEKTAGNLETLNGIGTVMYGRSDPCPECGSVVRRVWVVFVYIPVFPLSRYRVIDSEKHWFYSRKIRTTPK